MKRPFLTLFLFLASFSPPLEPLGTALAGQARPRLFILLVWDGLRPDSVTLREGPYSIVCKTLAIHAKADDGKTQPNGKSGAVVACALARAPRHRGARDPGRTGATCSR